MSRYERPATFEAWWERHGQQYEAAVIEGGGTPWPLDPEKRAETAKRLGLPDDTNPMTLREALWMRRNRKAA
ncbi:hypothetical protein RHA1_ro06557 [Rhodococcus jostii RHA1]|uniref:Uncharacterized protein n=1 Tax=Rhodococcus jostii (strain RHA1) TaxID=101510 RepID=Q0S2A6_RHOJR|nr:hypothetical protein [Rhodococcus jostii]ABG98330.1 hypothetical protein RHA1_ro06557 [Rhodococcus jostii RHA1]